MGRPRREQSQEQSERRKALISLAESGGWSKAALAAAAGIPASTLRVWWSGTRALDAASEARVAAVLRRQAAVDSSGPGAPRAAAPAVAGPDAGVTRALEALERLAGQERASDVDLRALARSQTAAALGTLVRLMLASKSDTVKQRAAEVLIERGWGKAPKPSEARPKIENVEDGELLAKLDALIKGST